MAKNLSGCMVALAFRGLKHYDPRSRTSMRWFVTGFRFLFLKGSLVIEPLLKKSEAAVLVNMPES